jgi:hypothetical protein
VFLFAFDLIELNGQDLRREPLEVRKRELGKLLRWGAQIGLQFNEHVAEPGEVVFRHACKLGLEGIVSKRLARLIVQAGRRMAEVRESGSAGSEAGGGRGLGQRRALNRTLPPFQLSPIRMVRPTVIQFEPSPSRLRP